MVFVAFSDENAPKPAKSLNVFFFLVLMVVTVFVGIEHVFHMFMEKSFLANSEPFFRDSHFLAKNELFLLILMKALQNSKEAYNSCLWFIFGVKIVFVGIIPVSPHICQKVISG